MSGAISPRLFVERIDGVTVATFADPSILAEEVIRDVDEQLSLLLEGSGSGKVLLSFRDVKFMSSAMLAVLVKVARRVEKAKGRLKICCLAPPLMEVFRMTRFDRLFEIHDGEASALDSF